MLINRRNTWYLMFKNPIPNAFNFFFQERSRYSGFVVGFDGRLGLITKIAFNTYIFIFV